MAEEKFSRIFPGEESSAQMQPPFSYFLFSSPPRPLQGNPKVGDKRAVYQNNVPKPKGVHHYYNLMWDNRVRRGPTYYTEADRRAEEGRRLRKMMTAPVPPRVPLPWDNLTAEKRQELKAERHLPAQLRAKRHIALQMELANQIAEASRLRKRARAKKRKEQEEALEKAETIRKQRQLMTKTDQSGWGDDYDRTYVDERSDSDEEEEYDENGQLVPKPSKTQENLKKVSSSDLKEEEYLRKMSLISADSDIELRDDEPSLVELDMEDRPSDDSQDEDEVPRQAKWQFPPVPSLDPSIHTEHSSQTFPGDFFHFRENAYGAVGHLVADAIKNAIYELCLEEEEKAIESHQVEFARRRQDQIDRMAQLQSRTKLVVNERLELEQSDEIEDRRKRERKEIKRQAMFSSGASGSVIHVAMKQLETDGFFGDLYLFRVESQFIPWINSSVELYTRNAIIGYQILDDIVDGVVSKRDEELIYANYRQSRSTKSGSLYTETREEERLDSFDETFFSQNSFL